MPWASGLADGIKFFGLHFLFVVDEEPRIPGLFFLGYQIPDTGYRIPDRVSLGAGVGFETHTHTQTIRYLVSGIRYLVSISGIKTAAIGRPKRRANKKLKLVHPM
jgi:hypothetical protein